MEKRKYVVYGREFGTHNGHDFEYPPTVYGHVVANTDEEALESAIKEYGERITSGKKKLDIEYVGVYDPNYRSWHRFMDQTGICVKCGEHSVVLLPCCNSGVSFEGTTIHYLDFCECNDGSPETCELCQYIEKL